MARMISCSTSTSIDSFSCYTGATDHVICSVNPFASYISVTNLFINLHNSQKVPVAYIATVHLTSSLSLYYAPYVPTFIFSILSLQ